MPLLLLLLAPLVTLTSAILFNGATFEEDVICDVDGRLIGRCTNVTDCNVTPTISDCDVIEGGSVCCPQVDISELDDLTGRIARRKCMEFAAAQQLSACPTRTPFDGNNEASLGEFPHVAALGYHVIGQRSADAADTPLPVVWLCAGSLVSERFLVTERVCAVGTWSTGRPRWARMGATALDNRDAGEQLIAVSSIHLHPGGDFVGVAALRLKTAVTWSATVRPACILAEMSVPARRVVAAGWGRDHNYAWTPRQILRKVDLGVTARWQCEQAYGSSKFLGFLPESAADAAALLCAGDMGGGKDTCVGDAGAPLMVWLSAPYCQYALLAVSAVGAIPCGQPHMPAAFYWLYPHLHWLEAVVWGREA